MTALKIAVLAVAGVILLSLLKNSGSVYSVVVRLALVAVTVMAVTPEIRELISAVDNIQVAEALSTQSLKIMLKIFGILTIGAVTADICRDNGENALADTVELSVKILAMVCALPVFTAVINVATSFINR